MELTKIRHKKEVIYTHTIFEIVADTNFDNNEKDLEIEWIDNQIEFINRKLVAGNRTLPNATIVHLMNILEELTIRKDYLMPEPDTIIRQFSTLEDDPAWRLHKKAQSGFELKVGSRQ